MTKKALGRSPWRWAITLVGLVFVALPLLTVLPWKDWYLGTVPDALFMVVLPLLIIAFGLWIAITAVRSGLVLDGDHLVNLPYTGLPRRVRTADIAGIGAEFGHNLAAPTVRMLDGATFLLTVSHTARRNTATSAHVPLRNRSPERLLSLSEEINPGT